MNSGDEFWIWREDERIGPYSAWDLWARAQEGEFDEDDLVIRPRQSPCTLESWLNEELRESEAVGRVEPVRQQQSQLGQNGVWEQEGGELERGQNLAGNTPGERDIDASKLTEEVISEVEAQVRRGLEGRDSESKPVREQLLWEGRPSLRSRPSLFLLAVVGIVPTAVQWLGIWSIPPLWWLAGLLLSCLILLLWPLAQHASFRVSDRRVWARRGRLVISTEEIHLGDVRAISCRRRGLAGLFDTGTLELRSGADGGLVRFEQIASPSQVEKLVRTAQASLKEV